uniref:Inner kinetochore subunit AME1 domain-containing protein n=1 Tax=Talaromyces marneffei PM1 TaxID=1077442 RepID=A0A093VJC9_TALMA
MASSMVTSNLYSDRQERLQMRQRGAGTRKIQAVDFGFSFGSPTGGAPALSIAQQLESVPETTNAVESTVDTTFSNTTAPVTERSARETPTRALRNSLATTESPRRSGRNSIHRVSTSNTTTQEQEEGRSSKRRRISTKNDNLIRPAASESEAIVNPSPKSIREDNPQDDVQNGVGASEELPEAPMVDVAGDEALLETTTIEQEAEPQAIVKTKRRGRPSSAQSQTNGAADQKQQNTDQTRRRSIRHSEINGSDPPNEDTNQDSQRGPSRARSRRGVEKQSTTEIEPEVDREREQEDRIPESSLKKRGRRRKDQEQPEPEPPEQQNEEENNEPTRKAPRGRRKRSRLSTEHIEVEEPQEEKEDTTTQTRNKHKGKNRAVEPDAERSVVEETEERAEETQKLQEDKARRKQQPQENGESSRRRGRPSLGKGQEPRPGPETTQTIETRPEASPEAVQSATRRRRRPSGGTTEAKPTSVQRTNRRREQDEEQEPRRREGTVSITVHRLANTHILDSTHATSDPSDNEQDSTDELEAVGKKFPSRNGVNAADVLSQICKEILEKHLATLDNNIANDAANQAKRSEYARQRKSIEAYGAQLEGRLFELSELLDSNFALGVQLKKAKREAAEMRNRLLEVRRQRQEITLRMDAVRRKHGEEENAKMSRNVINNTLHNLDLTLDRNRNRAADGVESEGNGVTGLEFLLRSVSENVSSSAEGSYGGLLRQVKAFNAQLEMTARKLER